MIEFLKRNPFVRLLVPLIFGIVMAFQSSRLPLFAFSTCIITVIALFGLQFFQKHSGGFKFRWVFGGILMILFVCAGILSVFVKGKEIEVVGFECNGKCGLIGTIAQPTEERTKSVQGVINVQQIKVDGKFVKAGAKLLVYFQKDSNSLRLKAGDVMVFSAVLSKLTSMGNPGEFDYSRYLNKQGIHYSAYVSAGFWKRLDGNGLSYLFQYSYNLREKLLDLFSHIGLEGNAYGVASALTIGDKAHLDTEIKQAYISAGAMHILAVSGMHVGLLYWVLNLLLSVFDRFKYWKYCKVAILLTTIWMYAIITGMSASVMRATVMFSFVIAGFLSRRNNSIYNSLAASAFFLLLWNPYNLLDVGFQLSYLAVFSIATLYPLIYGFMAFEKWLPNQVWSITACTLAAQIGTFPLSIYYFHQFPNLFLASNLIIIPFSTLIIYFSIVMMLSAGWDSMLAITGKLFNMLIVGLNKVVLFVDQLPFALSKGLYINVFEMVFLFGVIILITVYLIRRQTGYIVALLFCVLMLSGSALVSDYLSYKVREVVFYNHRDNTVVQFRDGKSCAWLVQTRNERVDNLIESVSKEGMINQTRVFILGQTTNLMPTNGQFLSSQLWVNGNYVQLGESTFVVANQNLNREIRMNADYLLLNRGGAYSLQPGDKCRFRNVIIDGTIATKQASKVALNWQKAAGNVYKMSERGALVVNVFNP